MTKDRSGHILVNIDVYVHIAIFQNRQKWFRSITTHFLIVARLLAAGSGTQSTHIAPIAAVVTVVDTGYILRTDRVGGRLLIY